MHALKLVFAILLAWLAAWQAAGMASAQPASARVAVAANFRAPMAELASAYQARTGHTLSVSAGSTGQLFAQIANGAPFDVFLSADQARPERLGELGLATAESRFTYAEGQLFLLLQDDGLLSPGNSSPTLGTAKRISLANPKTAPYGAAAMQVLQHLDFPNGPPLIAEAQSISGVNAAMTAGAVDAGFAAFSSVATLPPAQQPPGWLVPRTLHDPIRQDAILLNRGADNPAATGFLDWLRTEDAREIIRRYGYHVD